MRVGFASDNGTAVNECLLSNTTWWIYDIGDQADLVDKRTCMCSGSCRETCPFLSHSLKDCDLLFVQSTNPESYVQMASRGIQVLETTLPVESLLPRLIRCVAQKVSRNYFKRLFQLRNCG